MSNPEDKDLVTPHPLSPQKGAYRPAAHWSSGAGEEVFEAQVLEDKMGDFSLRPFLYVIFRHKWKILICFIFFSLATAYYVAHIPDSYVSEARLLVRGERRGVTFDPVGDGASLHKPGQYNSTIPTEFGIMASRQIAESVVERLGAEYILKNPNKKPDTEIASPTAQPEKESALQPIRKAVVGTGQKLVAWLRLKPIEPTTQELAINKISKNLMVDSSASASDVMIVEYKDNDPEKARTILNTLLDVYGNRHIDVYKNQISPQFFKDKSEDWERKIALKEKELESFQKSLKITSVESEKELRLTQLSSLDTKMIEYDLLLSSSLARQNALKALLDGQAKEIDGDTIALPMSYVDQRMREQLITLKLEEVDLASRYFEDDPRLDVVREKIAYMENTMSGRTSDNNGVLGKSLNPAYAELKLRIQTLQIDKEANLAAKSQLGTEIAQVRKSLALLTSNASRIAKMQRDKNILEEEFTQYAKSQQIAEINQTLDNDHVSNIRLIQAGSLPMTSARLPRKMYALLGMGGFMGLFLGVSLAVGREFIDQSCKTREDTETKLGLPVLASLPHSKRFVKKIKEIAA